MKSVFDSYPEIIFVDVYKLNNLRMPLYLICINSNGQDEIVLMFVTTMETGEARTKMVQTFKHTNPKWECTKVVMSGKDFNKRVVFKKMFPNVALHICLFHVLKRFRREITTNILIIIHTGERDHVLEIIFKLVYSKSESEYDESYQALLKSGLKTLISY